MESDPALTGQAATSFVKRLGERNICVDFDERRSLKNKYPGKRVVFRRLRGKIQTRATCAVPRCICDTYSRRCMYLAEQDLLIEESTRSDLKVTYLLVYRYIIRVCSGAREKTKPV